MSFGRMGFFSGQASRSLAQQGSLTRYAARPATGELQTVEKPYMRAHAREQGYAGSRKSFSVQGLGIPPLKPRQEATSPAPPLLERSERAWF